MNDKVRVQSDRDEQHSSTSGRGPGRMDGCFVRLQESTTDETYTDGFIDYVHEI